MRRTLLLLIAILMMSTGLGSAQASTYRRHHDRGGRNNDRIIASMNQGSATVTASSSATGSASSTSTTDVTRFQSPNNIIAGLTLGANIAAGSTVATGTTTSGTVTPPTTTSDTGDQTSGGGQTTPNSPNTATSGAYAALGDSVAAGLGLTPAADSDTRCGRSTQAYAYQIAQSRNLPLVHVACSGATVGDLFTNQGVTGPNIPPQLDAAFASGTPQLITITAGANDMQWLTFLRKCAAATCGTSTDTAAAAGLRAVLTLKLNFLFSEIQRRSADPPPTVVITGYSNPVSNECIGQQPYATAAEIAWINMERDALNQTISNAANQHSFAKYAPMDFTGHSLCSTDSWFQGLSDTAPLHPNAQGQAAIADSVLQTLGSTTTDSTGTATTKH